MDSLTQAALGAAVGHTLLGKHIGRTAPFVGAVLGTLPDLDVLIPFGGQVEDFTYHRSFSHSLVVQLAFAPLLTWLILHFRPSSPLNKRQWFTAILAIFWTHSLLDACTVYGTQLFWPITEHPFGISSVFIIDPFYTVPLLLGLYLAYKENWRSQRATIISTSAIVISTLYLCWGFVAKHLAEEKIAEAWTDQNANTKIVATLSTPMPLSSFLWRVVIDEGDRYRISHVGIWEDPKTIKFKSFPKRTNLLNGLEDHWDVQRLVWFTKGFYKAQVREGQIVVSDLRMGVEGSYAFNFAIAEQINTDEYHSDIDPIKAKRINDSIDWTKLPLLWDRLWDSSVSLHPQDYVSSSAGNASIM
jgi:inner membrane protein